MRAPLLPRHSHTFQKYRHYPDFLPAPAAPSTSPAPCRSGLKAALPRCPRPASASRLPWRGRAPLTAVGWDHSPGKGPTTLPLVDHINDDSGWPLSRSEEHTSELQSRENLVCRLLLEKKTTLLIMSRPVM